MTEDERLNRNPAIETKRTTLESIERDHPKVTASELQIHKVYVVQSGKTITTLNYMGKRMAIHPVTLDTIVTHHFYGPRAGIHVFLAARFDGAFEDAVGTRITVRLWTGEDA